MAFNLIEPRKIPRKEIPQGPVPLDLSHPLAQRVIVAVTPHFSVTPGGHAALRTAPLEIKGAPPGLATTGGSSSIVRATNPSVVLRGVAAGGASWETDITVALVLGSASADAWVMDRQGAAPLDLRRDATGNLSANTGSGALFSGVAWPSGAAVVVVHMGRGNGNDVTPRAWFDGVAANGSAAVQDSWASLTFVDTAFFGSTAFPTSNLMLGTGCLAVVFRGLFSDADEREFRQNYAALFEPEMVWEAVTTPVVTSTGTIAAVETGSDAANIAGGPIAAGTFVAVETGSDTALFVGVVIAAGTLVAVGIGADIADFFGGTVITSTGTMVAVETGRDTASVLGASDISTTALAVWGYRLPNGQRAEDALVTLYSLLFEVHQMQGLRLGFPLIISPTSRTSGTIAQTIANDGTTTTVTRV